MCTVPLPPGVNPIAVDKYIITCHRVRGEMHKGFWCVKLRAGDYLKDLGVDGRIILNWVFYTWDGAWTGLILLRVRTGGVLFCMG